MLRREAKEIDAMARAKNGHASGCVSGAALILASWVAVFVVFGAFLRWWGWA